MFSRLRIFAPPEFPVLSLGVQAQMPSADARERSQFHLLVRHFLERFFNNNMVSADGETKARFLQVVYAIALPGMVVALFLFPMYHAPLARSFWSKASDHYFFVLYTFVGVGGMSIFAWDLLFPDLLDLFILSSLPITDKKLFLSRIVAACFFLGIFLLGTCALGAIFFPLMSDPPELGRHVFAHLAAVLCSGVFAGGFILSLQGMIETVLGERVFRTISPFLQGISTMVLLTILLLFPVISQFLRVATSFPGARYFPPFWFLGMYESLLAGSSSLPVFRGLAKTGCKATALILLLVVVSYPLAYRRRMRCLVESSVVLDTRNSATLGIHRLLHATLLRNPVQRGIYHFISYSLLRTQRHRVYMAMYGGLGLALLTSAAVLLKRTPGHLAFSLSPDGLRAAVPVAAFWTIAGLRTAFLSPADRGGAWVFRVILGKPGAEQLATTVLWILSCALILTMGVVVLIRLLAPAQLLSWKSTASHALIAAGLCLLLTDALFLKVRSIPFTGEERPSDGNFAVVLLQYFGFFPPLVWLVVALEPWLEARLWNVAVTTGIIGAVHIWMHRVHKKDAEYHANLIDLDDYGEEFPQRLGLRY